LKFEEAEVGYYSEELVASVIPFANKNSYLVICGNKNGVILEEFIVKMDKINSPSSKVDYYDNNGNPTISFSVDNGKIGNIISHSKSNNRVSSWDSCATCAVTSCGSDGGCAILCGLTTSWCLSAITLACLVPDLSC